MTDREKRIAELEAEIAKLKTEENKEEEKPRLVVEKTPAAVRGFVTGDYYVRDTKLDKIIPTSYSDDKEWLEKKTAELNAIPEEDLKREAVGAIMHRVLMDVLEDMLED